MAHVPGTRRSTVIRRAALAAALAASLAGLAFSAPVSTAQAQQITVERSRHAGEFLVPLNKSQVLRSDRPFDEVSVGNPDIADVVPLTTSTIYVLGKQLGSTSLTLTGANGQIIAILDVVVTFDIAGLKSKLFELLPNERIEVRQAGGAVVLSGQVADARSAEQAVALADRFAPERVTNLMTIGGAQQVLLAMRIAEVQRSTAKQLGLNTLLFDGGDFRFFFNSGVGISPESFASGGIGFTSGGFSFDGVFDALERKGLVRTLAEPNLVALSGGTASFLAGGEFPIPVAQDSDIGGSTITIEFKQFGVSLAFTPTVLGDNMVNLMIDSEVSAIDPTLSVRTIAIDVPGLSVRRAKTTVELRDGQSFAIAGLLQDDFTDAVRQFPWLGDAPVLGALLRSTEYQRKQTELVVIVTPRLVAPQSMQQLATPLEGTALPTEADLYLFGRTEGKAAGQLAAGSQGGGIDGPHGYILP